MYHVDEPGEMTALERFREVAAILATGFLRLKKESPDLTGASSADSQLEAIHGKIHTDILAEKSAEFTENPLDCPIHQSLHCATG